MHITAGDVYDLTRSRLQLGAQMLSSTSFSLPQIAAEVGCESEAAFNRASNASSRFLPRVSALNRIRLMLARLNTPKHRQIAALGLIRRGLCLHERGRQHFLNATLMSLNRPTTDASWRWTGAPSWYLWDGGVIALGRSEGIVPSHEHHTNQIVIAVEGAVGIRGKRGDWRMAPGVTDPPEQLDAN